MKRARKLLCRPLFNRDGKVVPSPAAVREVERKFKRASPEVKLRLAQSITLSRAFEAEHGRAFDDVAELNRFAAAQLVKRWQP